jgi:hypothetical protein
VGVLSRVAAVVAAIAGAQALSLSSGQAAVIVDSLLVRVYDGAGLSRGDRKRALDRAGDILARVEIEPAWLDCASPALVLSTASCAAPPAPGELVVRLVRATPDANRHHPRTLGYSLLDTATGLGTLATVFIDRVDLLARAAHADRAAVLGRAIAHEMGHLILRTNRHSGGGLMREHWTSEEIRRDRAEDWHFTAAERETLRAAVESNAAIARARAGSTGSGGQNPHVLLDKNP